MFNVSPNIVAHIFNPSTHEADLDEFEISTIDKVSSGLARSAD